jgi:hypothetical protein
VYVLVTECKRTKAKEILLTAAPENPAKNQSFTKINKC